MKAAALLLMLASLLTSMAPVVAQAAPTPIYRCGPDGKTFSQAPCAGGTQVESSDSRSDAQRAQARRVAADERNQAAQMAKERRLREAADRKANKPPPVAVSTAASGPRHTRLMVERTQRREAVQRAQTAPKP